MLCGVGDSVYACFLTTHVCIEDGVTCTVILFEDEAITSAIMVVTPQVPV